MHHTDSKMDKLQAQIVQWFTLFKEGIKEQIGSELKRAFDFMDSHPEIPENHEFWKGRVPNWDAIIDIARPRTMNDTQLPAVLHLRYDKADPDSVLQAAQTRSFIEDMGIATTTSNNNLTPVDHSLWRSVSVSEVPTHTRTEQGQTHEDHERRMCTHRSEEPRSTDTPMEETAGRSTECGNSHSKTSDNISKCMEYYAQLSDWDCEAYRHEIAQLREDLSLLQVGLEHYKAHEQQLEERLANSDRNNRLLKDMLADLGVNEDNINTRLNDAA